MLRPPPSLQLLQLRKQLLLSLGHIFAENAAAKDAFRRGQGYALPG